MEKNQLVKRDPVAALAETLGYDRDTLVNVLMKTVMPSATTKEHAIAFCGVAKSLGLDPLKKEIYAFPGKSGGVQPIVGVDGWVTMARKRDPQHCVSFVDTINDAGGLVSILATVYNGAGKRLASVTEYMAECRGTTDPWKRWPARMLRHKAMIQAYRIAYGFSGIMEEDEYERMMSQPREAEVVHKDPQQALKARLQPPAPKVEAEPESAPAEPWPAEAEDLDELDRRADDQGAEL